MAFESGVVPEDWSAVIVPLYKGKGEKSECKRQGIIEDTSLQYIYINLGRGESGFNCWRIRGSALVSFLFYVNVSGMRPRSRLSSQHLTISAPWVLLRVRWSIPLVKWFRPG